MDLTNEEFDLFLNSLITQLTMKPTEKEINNFDFSKVNYNDFYKDNAEEILRVTVKLIGDYFSIVDSSATLPHLKALMASLLARMEDRKNSD